MIKKAVQPANQNYQANTGPYGAKIKHDVRQLGIDIFSDKLTDNHP
jgi:hypothetical protein